MDFGRPGISFSRSLEQLLPSFRSTLAVRLRPQLCTMPHEHHHSAVCSKTSDSFNNEGKGRGERKGGKQREIYSSINK